MIQTEHFALPCPSGEDYAALPLYMQRLAEQVEADNIEQRAALNRALHPPTIIWRSNALGFSFGSNGFEQLFFGPGDCIFVNYPLPGGALPQFSSGTRLFTPGIWHIGLTVAVQEVGALSPDTFRRIQLFALKDDSTGTGAAVELLAQATNITVGMPVAGLGVTHIHCELVFEVGQDAALYSVLGSFQHGNIASNMQRVATVAWYRRIGGNEILEVV